MDTISIHQIIHAHPYVLIIIIQIHSHKHVKIVYLHVRNVKDHFSVSPVSIITIYIKLAVIYNVQKDIIKIQPFNNVHNVI